MKARISSISIFCLLAISLLTIASNDASAINNENAKTVQKNSLPDQTSTISQSSKSTRQVEIDLNDGVSVNTNDPQNEGHRDIQQNAKPTLYQQIDLTEKLAISVNKPDQDMIILVKQSSDNLTTLERITGIDRLRFDGKKLVEQRSGLNLFYHEPLEIISYAQNKIRTIDELTAKNIEPNIINSIYYKLAPTLGIQFDSISTSLEYRTQLIVGNSYVLGNDLAQLSHTAADLKNPTLLIMLVPLSGYILLRSEDAEITFYKSKRFVSLVLFVIIISSTAVGPISVSPSFLAYAYSQTNESNTSAIISEQNLTQSNPVISFNGYSNSTQPVTISNSTQPVTLSNSTQPVTISNSTQPVTISNSTQPVTLSNSTQTPPHFDYSNSTYANSTQTPPHFDYSNSTYANSTQTPPHFDYSNSTQPVTLSNSTQSPTLPNPTQSPTLPNSTQSWNFGPQDNNTKTVGQIGIANQTNKTVLQLQGNGFLTANGSATKELKDLTISAWVKPDYTQGAPVFTVLSKENEFTLSINNEIPPYKTAQFSVFDGIKWNTVNSTVPIGQSWNELAAT
ncbi:MAG: hypothetical protein ACREBB_01210, partial [Nitrosotalea sp.]